MVRAMCGVQLKYWKRTKDLILMLGLNETMRQLAMVKQCVGMDMFFGGMMVIS